MRTPIDNTCQEDIMAYLTLDEPPNHIKTQQIPCAYAVERLDSANAYLNTNRNAFNLLVAIEKELLDIVKILNGFLLTKGH